MSHTMNKFERETYLIEARVGVISTIVDDRTLTVPIWYDYEPGGDVWIISADDSLKGRALAASGRYSLCVQSRNLPYRYVSVEGPITSIAPCPEDVRVAMAVRYLGEEMGAQYITTTAPHAARSTVYRMTPERWYTVDYSKQPTT